MAMPTDRADKMARAEKCKRKGDVVAGRAFGPSRKNFDNSPAAIRVA